MIKTDYSREELINICEKNIIKIDKWTQYSLEDNVTTGECWALLKAGCPFKIITESDFSEKELLKKEELSLSYTTEDSLVFKITVPEGKIKGYYFDL